MERVVRTVQELQRRRWMGFIWVATSRRRWGGVSGRDDFRQHFGQGRAGHCT